MKTGLVAVMIAAVVMASSMAVYAHNTGAPPDEYFENPQDRGWGLPQQEMASPFLGPTVMEAGGPPRELLGGNAGMHGCPPGVPNPGWMRRAGASERQIQALEEYMFEQQMKLIDLWAASEKAEMTMERLRRASDVDEKALLQAVDALNQTRGVMFRTEVESWIKVKQVLGEEILRKLREQGPLHRSTISGPRGDR